MAETGYRELAGYYSLLFPLNDRQRGFFEYLVQSGPADPVLDMGCGTGEHLSWFSARNLRTYGLEPDAAMFRELEEFGDYDRSPFSGTSPALILVGRREDPGKES